jgi:hypothetical protein
MVIMLNLVKSLVFNAIDKHNSIVNGIFGHMKKANITCSSETFNPMNDTRQRAGDIYMPEFDMYGDALWMFRLLTFVLIVMFLELRRVLIRLSEMHCGSHIFEN